MADFHPLSRNPLGTKELKVTKDELAKREELLHYYYDFIDSDNGSDMGSSIKQVDTGQDIQKMRMKIGDAESESESDSDSDWVGSCTERNKRHNRYHDLGISIRNGPHGVEHGHDIVTRSRWKHLNQKSPGDETDEQRNGRNNEFRIESDMDMEKSSQKYSETRSGETKSNNGQLLWEDLGFEEDLNKGHVIRRTLQLPQIDSNDVPEEIQRELFLDLQ